MPMQPATWKRYVCAMAGLLLTTPLAAETVQIIVNNHAGTTIQLIDAATNRVVQTIDGFEAPEGAQPSPDGSRIYITTASENVLTVFDRAANRIIKKVPISGHANDLVVTKDGKYVLVCISEEPGAIDVIDTASLTLIKTIPSHSRMHDIVVTNDNKYAVAGSPEGKAVMVYDLAKLEQIWELELDRGVMPLSLEHHPDGSASRILVNLSRMDGFAAIDFNTRKEVARVRNPEPQQGRGFGRRSDTSHGIGVAPDNKTVWVVSRVTNYVYVYSLPDMKLVGQVPFPVLELPGQEPVGASPHWITFSPDSKTVYISLDAIDEVLVVDVATRKEKARIKTGIVPRRISTLVAP